MTPARDGVWLVSFDPATGGQIQKTRPAVVLSNDTANPCSTGSSGADLEPGRDRLYPAETYAALNGERRNAMADQIITASKRRLQRRLGALGREDLAAVARVVHLQLGLRSAAEGASLPPPHQPDQAVPPTPAKDVPSPQLPAQPRSHL